MPTSIIRRLQHLGNTSLLSYSFRALEFISKSFPLTRVWTYFQIIMPPQREAKGRPTRLNVEEPEFPNAPEVQTQEEVSNVEFTEAIRMLSYVVTNQVGQQRIARQE